MDRNSFVERETDRAESRELLRALSAVELCKCGLFSFRFDVCCPQTGSDAVEGPGW